MDISKALQTLQDHNKWRRSNDLGSIPLDPMHIGQAIDEAISFISNNLNKPKVTPGGMTVAYIAHPIGGDVVGNLAKIQGIVKGINLHEPDVVPFVPYYSDCVALDDSKPEHRQRGMKNTMFILKSGIVKEVRLYGDVISKGMLEEIVLAWKLDIDVFPYTDEIEVEYESILKMKKYTQHSKDQETAWEDFLKEIPSPSKLTKMIQSEAKGAQDVFDERKKQLEIYPVMSDVRAHEQQGLAQLAREISKPFPAIMFPQSTQSSMSENQWSVLRKKPYRQRLVIAGAWMAAAVDCYDWLQKHVVVE